MAYDGKVMREALQRFEEDKQRRASQRRPGASASVGRSPAWRRSSAAAGHHGAHHDRGSAPGGGPGPGSSESGRRICPLQQERAQLLTDHGYPADALVDKPRCVLCGDTGYCGGRICACLQKYYAQEQIRSLSSLLDVGSQSFDTFGLEWYDTQPGESGRSPRQLMERNLATCQRYAAEFGKKPANLLLDGAPGLGKTFLSACIARVVSEDGFSVVYDTAVHVFARCEAAKFRADEEPDAAVDVRRFESCDLLILDDLGTEMTTGFVQSALYQLVNGRLLAERSTIISTNLTPPQLGAATARLSGPGWRGSTRFCPLAGEDIRKAEAKKP